ncbi:ABC transporter ATP-binding protein [Phyllobacterium sp. P30BS-XVII]|uniref:ABC transporter ATP-binding protein n=1 Tax=Phyllobacterium sp. P30BS-XVII TaxID=2587046 RepID=UPI0015FAF63B|nr:ABC transporter ATP-binding protein [Phyllobacterium sp. P30BS-XVII]MBA8902968.1 peptide/nickel transport system ATP-binding protein [Phyllobacterium sp. P30BS-XVII]
MPPLVEFQSLSTYFKTDEGVARAVQDVSFTIGEGETVGVVGESGCGKSVTALSLMGLVSRPSGYIAGGQILYRGQDLLTLKPEAMRTMRGNEIAMIFQEPMSSLNPVLTIGEQIVEPLIEHRKMPPKAAWAEAIALLARVGIARPERIVEGYPHQLSGGMLQRVMIAIALSCKPKLLIADEPTTALDVTIQAQILDLLNRLKQDEGTALMLITHDLGLVAELADRVIVMYAGRVVETGTVRDVLRHPKHPYTRGLLASRPVPGQRLRRLVSIPGQVPSPARLPAYCAFAERCFAAVDICRSGIPSLGLASSPHRAACFLAQSGAI